MGTAKSDSSRTLLSYASVAAIAFMAFVPALYGTFVWDDVIIAQFLDRGVGFFDIWLTPSLTGDKHYWPLKYSSLWLEHMLWANNPRGYHLTNVAIHGANSAMVLALLKKLKAPAPWMCAAIFAVHPAHVDSVAWVMGRKDVLSAFFLLAASMAYIRWDRSKTPRRMGFVLVVVLFAAAMLSKSTAVAFPVAIVAYHWYQTGSLKLSHFLKAAPFAAVAAIYTIADTTWYRSQSDLSLGISAFERPKIAARAMWHYAQSMVWPFDLVAIHPKWTSTGYLHLAVLVAAAALVFVLRKRIGRGPIAAIVLFAAFLAPLAGFVDYGYMDTSYVTNRYLYIPSIAATALLTWAAVALTRRLPPERPHRSLPLRSYWSSPLLPPRHRQTTAAERRSMRA